MNLLTGESDLKKPAAPLDLVRSCFKRGIREARSTIFFWPKGPSTMLHPGLQAWCEQNSGAAAKIAYTVLSEPISIKSFLRENQDKEALVVEHFDAILASKTARQTAINLLQYCGQASGRRFIGYSRVAPVRGRQDFGSLAEEFDIDVRPWPSYEAIMLTDSVDVSFRDLLANKAREIAEAKIISDRVVLRSVLAEICVSVIDQALTPPRPSERDIEKRWMRDKLRDDTPPDFIRRWYSSYLGTGFTRADLRRCDRSLEMALRNWLRNNDMPPDLARLLPTVKGQTDELLTAHSAITAEIGHAPTRRAAQRIVAARHRRDRRNG